MAKSLGCLEGALSKNKYIRLLNLFPVVFTHCVPPFILSLFICFSHSSSNFSAVDILVGFPLLSLPPQVCSPYPNLSTWLAEVRKEAKPFSEELITGKPSEQGEKTANKSKKDGKANKGKVVEKKIALRKLRILCIHGYRQNGKTFREKLGSFR